MSHSYFSSSISVNNLSQQIRYLFALLLLSLFEIASRTLLNLLANDYTEFCNAEIHVLDSQLLASKTFTFIVFVAQINNKKV